MGCIRQPESPGGLYTAAHLVIVLPTCTRSTMYILAYMYVNLRGWVMHDRVTHRCLSDASSKWPIARPAIAVPGNGPNRRFVHCSTRDGTSRRFVHAPTHSLRGCQHPRLPSNVKCARAVCSNRVTYYVDGDVRRGRRCESCC